MCPVAFDPATEDAVAALAEQEVDLPGGGRLRIQPTPALVAIDIDAGGAVDARQGKVAAHLAANRAALPELARQIRLRNLSGAILVDFAGLPARRRAALGPELQSALSDDPLHPRLLGFTMLGLAEIVRPRVHPPLHELLAGPHAAGLAALRRVAAEPLRRAAIARRTGGCRRTRGGRRGAGGSCTPRRTFLDSARGPRLAARRNGGSRLMAEQRRKADALPGVRQGCDGRVAAVL